MTGNAHSAAPSGASNAAAVPVGAFQVQAQEQIVFGKPAEVAVLELARQRGAKRVFLTSGRTLGSLQNGPLQKIAAALGELHCGSFAAITAHSPREDVIAGAQAARAAGADLLVAVGGGSVIDATKAMLGALWMNMDSPAAMEPYRTGVPADQARRIEAPAQPLRMIAVSTTLSASEFTPIAGVTDSATHTKQSFTHRLFAPVAVVLDPRATLDTPLDLLFNTGIRAVDHAAESFCSPFANPATEALALQGLKLLYRGLPAMQADPTDLNARMTAQFGMWQAIAGFAGGARMGASHGIGYALGATFGIAHGHTSCIMLPAVLQYNAAQNAARQRELSIAMGQPEVPAHRLIGDLIRGLKQPSRLADVKIGAEHFEDIARRALVYPNLRDNPTPLTTPEQVIEVLRLAA
ncbi:MAG: iron-containing alcohol dehydrogenase [Burkholderiaceae bacterium]